MPFSSLDDPDINRRAELSPQRLFVALVLFADLENVKQNEHDELPAHDLLDDDSEPTGNVAVRIDNNFFSKS